MSDGTAVGHDPRIGNTFAGYELEAQLGRGERSVVYRATDTKSLRRVALKVFDPLPSGDPQFRARFLEETELVRTLRHTSIVRIYEAGEAEGHLYVARAYVDGFDLGTALSLAGKLEPRRAIGILGAVADALDTARWARGLVHGSVKPSNILIPAPGSDAKKSGTYLTDFGTRSAIPWNERGSASEAPVGVDYVAPEQIDGRPISPRTDVYALGCVLYECLTGKPPYAGSTGAAVLRAHLRAEPPATNIRGQGSLITIDAVIAKALAKWPEERYSTCLELALATHKALTPRAMACKPAVTEPPRPKPSTARSAPPPRKTPEPQPATEEHSTVPPVTRRRITRTGLLTGLLIGVALVALVVAAITITDGSSDELVEIVEAAAPDEVAVLPAQAPDIPAVDGSETVVKPAQDHRLVLIDAEAGGIVRTISPQNRGRLDTYAFGRSAAWLAAPTEGTVSRLDLQSRAVTQTVDVPGSPIDLALGRASVWVVGTNRGFQNETRIPEGPVVLTRVSPRTGRVLTATDLELTTPEAIAVGVTGVWVAGTGPDGHALVRVEPQTGEVVASISLEERPIAVATVDRAVWVAGRSFGVIANEPPRNTLARINPATNEIEASIELPDPPGELLGSLAAGPRSAQPAANPAVWVVSESIGSLTQVDQATNEVIRTFQVDDASTRAGPWGLGVAVGGGSVWVASFLHKHVKQLDPNTGAVIATIRVPGRPIDIQAAGDAVWVTVIPTDDFEGPA